MNAYEVYTNYLAIKRHFTDEKYNYVKYNGKLKNTFSSFEKRNDKYSFEKLAKQNDVKNILLANIVKNSNVYIRYIISDDGKKIYQEWLKRNQNISNTFRRDISALDMTFKNNFTLKEHNHPHLLKLYLQEKISLETFALICKITKCSTRWDELLKDDYIWKEIRVTVKKYPDLLEYDMSKLFDLLKEQFV